jgi:hypothetical protein
MVTQTIDPILAMSLRGGYDISHAENSSRGQWWTFHTTGCQEILRRAVMYDRLHGIAAHRWYRTGRMNGVHPNFDDSVQVHMKSQG